MSNAQVIHNTGLRIVTFSLLGLNPSFEQRLWENLPPAEAMVKSGMMRFRPFLLTALAVVVGASVILTDPIFQGLAISLMTGAWFRWSLRR